MGDKFDIESALRDYPEHEVAQYLAEQHGIDRDAFLKDNHTDKDFIKEFEDKVDWVCISKYQHLSEDFIREFKDKKDKVDWNNISKFQHKIHVFNVDL